MFDKEMKTLISSLSFIDFFFFFAYTALGFLFMYKKIKYLRLFYNNINTQKKKNLYYKYVQWRLKMF